MNRDLIFSWDQIIQDIMTTKMNQQWHAFFSKNLFDVNKNMKNLKTNKSILGMKDMTFKCKITQEKKNTFGDAAFPYKS